MTSINLLESLAEARMDASYLERKAREAKDKALADKFAARGKELKIQISGLRAAAHEEWAAGARKLAPRLKAAQGRLKDSLRKAGKNEAWARHAGKALDALDDVLSLAAKALG